MYSIILSLVIGTVLALTMYVQSKGDSWVGFVVVAIVIAMVLFLLIDIIIQPGFEVTYELSREVQIYPIEGNVYVIGNDVVGVNTGEKVKYMEYIEDNVKILTTNGQAILRKYKTKYVNENANKWFIIPNWGWTEIYIN